MKRKRSKKCRIKSYGSKGENYEKGNIKEDGN
jgi:hypothetical protein